MRVCVALPALLGWLFSLSVHAEVRSWTNEDGKTIQAELLRLEDEGKTAVLNLKGKEYRVPRSRLSAGDQAFLDQWKPEPGSSLSPNGTVAGTVALAGTPLEAGERVKILLPLDKQERRWAEKGIKGEVGTNDEILQSEFAIAVPPGFNPETLTPVLVVSSTSDGNASSVSHMKSYIETANAEGYLVIAADWDGGKPEGDGDTDGLRWAVLHAGLREMWKTWPKSREYPYAAAGFSGGAKRTFKISALLCSEKLDFRGFFLGGCNQYFGLRGMELAGNGRRLYKKAKVFVSNGESDTISTVAHAKGLMKGCKGLFDEARLELYEDTHRLHKPHVQAALKWFLEDERR
ncbi:MAG: hypothetical protein AAF514_12090 [Verrucomicrobiota bacterium]